MKVYGILIQEEKVLALKDENDFYSLPGGEPRKGESNEKFLSRIFQEYMPNQEIKIEYLGVTSRRNPNSKEEMLYSENYLIRWMYMDEFYDCLNRLE